MGQNSPKFLTHQSCKLYDTDSCVLGTFAGSGADFTIGLPDCLILWLAFDPSDVVAWVRTNLLPYLLLKAMRCSPTISGGSTTRAYRARRPGYIADKVVPHLLLKALKVTRDDRLWLPIPISLLLLSSTTSSSKISPLLVGLVASLMLDFLFVGLAKLIVHRPRLAYNAANMYVVVAVDHWSFLSGHSSCAFLVIAFLTAVDIRRDVLFLWAAVMSASRANGMTVKNRANDQFRRCWGRRNGEAVDGHFS